jgi:tRNA(adenine34) deaminase
MTDDERFMDAALTEARRAAEHGEVPVGAVVVHGGRIIGRGHNRCEALQDATAHAEILAITAASNHLESWRLEDCTLYVTLEPCPMCLGACLNARVGRVVYATPEPKAGACGSVVDLSALPGFNHRLTVTPGVRGALAADLMTGFFRELRARRKRELEGETSLES